MTMLNAPIFAKRPRSRRVLLQALLFRAVLFSLLWWVLTEGASPLSLWGLTAVGAAVGASLGLLPAEKWTLRILPMARFVPFFLWQSLLGGLDVAVRALRPGMAVQPQSLRHQFCLQQEPARVVFLWVISLLPGTAGVDLKGDEASVHVLDAELADPAKLRDLERRIAGLFDEKRA